MMRASPTGVLHRCRMSTSSPTTPQLGTELTLRGIVLGILITLVFTAANVYFGLKAGLTFATSIPAAVISMALLRRAAGNSIGETNIVQTIASSAGTLSSIIFVLPGLVMIGWWTGFPYWMSVTLCALGGILGVMYSIPLRRALVTNSPLPYPEGVACAEVLKVGHASDSGESSRQGLAAIIVGSVVSAGFSIVVATQLFAANLAQYFRLPGSDKGGNGPATGYDLNFSFALLAVGHLVGLWVGIAILVGALIGWLGGVPFLTQGVDGAAEAVALFAWSKKVRFIGAGCIAVAAIWTLVKLAKPVAAGLHSAAMSARVRKAGRADTLPRNEQDIPIGTVGLITLACMLHSGSQCCSEETAVTRGDQAALRNRLAGGDRIAHHGTQQLVHVGLAVDEVSVLDHFLGPSLKRHRVCGDDRAHRQSALGDQHLGALGDLRGGVCLGSARSDEQAPSSHGGTDRNDQRTKQQHQLLFIHG